MENNPQSSCAWQRIHQIRGGLRRCLKDNGMKNEEVRKCHKKINSSLGKNKDDKSMSWGERRRKVGHRKNGKSRHMVRKSRMGSFVRGLNFTKKGRERSEGS